MRSRCMLPYNATGADLSTPRSHDSVTKTKISTVTSFDGAKPCGAGLDLDSSIGGFLCGYLDGCECCRDRRQCINLVKQYCRWSYNYTAS